MSKYFVGDRITASGDDRQSQCLGTVVDVNKKIITITWGNGLSAEYTPKQMQSYGYQKFLEDEEATECNSNTPASLQESSALNSELRQPELVIDGYWGNNISATPIYPGVRRHLNKRRECNDLYARAVCPLQAAIAIK